MKTLRISTLALTLLLLGCRHAEEKIVKSPEVKNSFILELEKSSQKNIQVGYIENNLFGDTEATSDENGIKNRKINVFYFIKKAIRENSPYLIFFNGGPGIAITDMFFQYQYGDFLPDVNVIFFDQRGNGLSEKPTSDINELKYYSAKYIISDAEKIRETLLGRESKWIVFGQSYGGSIARKYIELKPKSIKRVITHGSAKYDAVDVAVNTELNTLGRLNAFYAKYPDDLKRIEQIKNELTDSESVCSRVFCIKGKGLIHLLAILYSIKSDEDFHDYLSKLNKENLKQSFLGSIKPLSDLILNAGLVNQAVAQIDLIGDISTDEVSIRAKDILKSKGFDVKNAILSKTLFDESLVTISDEFKHLENNFKNHKIKTDTVDLDIVNQNCNKYNIPLDVFGGMTDTLAINSIKNEEKYIKSKNSNFIRYHYSTGHHREWLTNSGMFKDLIRE